MCDLRKYLSFLQNIVHCLSSELAYFKHGNSKEIHFQEIVVSGNILQW